ncbi:hypothetical protein GCM10027454_08380 [Algoriphagus aestuariicola]
MKFSGRDKMRKSSIETSTPFGLAESYFNGIDFDLASANFQTDSFETGLTKLSLTPTTSH